MGDSVISLARTLARTILEPLLSGSTLDKAESIVDQAGHQSMNLLSFLDDQVPNKHVLPLLSVFLSQLYALGELVETRFNSVFTPVRSRGLIGFSAASISSHCEEPLSRKTNALLRLVNLFVYMVSYAFGLASVWLLQRSRVEGKHQLQTTDDDDDEYQQQVYVESKLPAEDHELAGTPQDFVKQKVDDDLNEQDFVKEKVIDELHEQDPVKENGKEQQEDEPDELTKLFDATWSLGTL